MPGPRLNNRRVYPDANHQPNHLASRRKSEAIERQEEYNKLSLEEKIARLPPEPHAKKHRARLLAQLDQRNQPKQNGTLVPGELYMVAADTSPKTKIKKYMKGSK